MKKAILLIQAVILTACIFIPVYAAAAYGDGELILKPTQLNFGDSGQKSVDLAPIRFHYVGGTSYQDYEYLFSWTIPRFYKFNGRTYQLESVSDVRLWDAYDAQFKGNANASATFFQEDVTITWKWQGLEFRERWGWLGQIVTLHQESGTQTPITDNQTYFRFYLQLKPVGLDDIYDLLIASGLTQQEIIDKLDEMIEYIPTDTEDLNNALQGIDSAISSGDALLDTIKPNGTIPTVDTDSLLQGNFGPLRAFFDNMTNEQSAGFGSFIVVSIVAGVIIMCLQHSKG